MSGQIEICELAIGTPPRRLFIVDRLVEPEAAGTIFSHLRDQSYTLTDSDRADTQEYNHFKHDFATGDDADDPIVHLLADKAREIMLSQGIECGPILRIYANLNMFGDFQFAHHDGDGWTALLFANSEWREDWGGEFIAYAGADTPFAYAIAPRPGGMLIFDGLIHHRGGVPSKFCHLPRITLAIKFERDGDSGSSRN
ncbi:MAG: hypothetical protein ABIR60_03990 [Allosphingosinicella sp.]